MCFDFSIQVAMEPAGPVSKASTQPSRWWGRPGEFSDPTWPPQEPGALAGLWGRQPHRTPPPPTSRVSTSASSLPTGLAPGPSTEATSSSKTSGCGATTSTVPSPATPRLLWPLPPACLPTSAPTLTSNLTSTNSSHLYQFKVSLELHVTFNFF